MVRWSMLTKAFQTWSIIIFHEHCSNCLCFPWDNKCHAAPAKSQLRTGLSAASSHHRGSESKRPKVSLESIIRQEWYEYIAEGFCPPCGILGFVKPRIYKLRIVPTSFQRKLSWSSCCCLLISLSRTSWSVSLFLPLQLEKLLSPITKSYNSIQLCVNLTENIAPIGFGIQSIFLQLQLVKGVLSLKFANSHDRTGMWWFKF